MKTWTPIFKAGTHTDSSGKTHTWTVADLDRAVDSYNPAQHTAPLVIGHPRTDAPAMGWIKGLKRTGEILLAHITDVPNAVKEAVQAGSYRMKSAAFYADGSLRHVGLLGAMPPAVKGLGAVEFGDGDDWAEVVFNENDDDQKNQEDTENEMTEQEIAALKARAEAAEAEAAAAKQAKEEADANAAAAEAARTKAETEKAEAEAAHAEAQVEQAKKDREAKFAELVEGGKVLPTDKELVMGIAQNLEDGEELTFAEGGESVTKPAADAFWALLGGRNSNGLLAEFAEEPKGDSEPEITSAEVAKIL